MQISVDYIPTKKDGGIRFFMSSWDCYIHKKKMNILQQLKESCGAVVLSCENINSQSVFGVDYY